jgi:hypothetical protein
MFHQLWPTLNLHPIYAAYEFDTLSASDKAIFRVVLS